MGLPVIVPLVLEGISLAEELLPSIVKAIQFTKSVVHKTPGADKMTPQQVTAAQTISLQAAKTDMMQVAAKSSVPVPGDSDIAKLIELFYQVDQIFSKNPLTANVTEKINSKVIAPALTVSVPLYQLIEMYQTQMATP